MKTRKFRCLLHQPIVILFTLLSGFAILSGQSFNFDFEDGYQEWKADFADYPVGDSARWNLNHVHQAMPDIVPVQNGLRMVGDNFSDDLFFFVKRKIEGLHANTKFQIIFSIDIVTNMPPNAIGGSDLMLKAGATIIEPQKIIVDEDGILYYRMNINKDIHSQPSTDMDTLGRVHHDVPDNFTYHVANYQNGMRPFEVLSDSNGELWVIIGAESQFEGPAEFLVANIEFRLDNINSIAETLFVDADASGANNGSSWTDAYTDLQTALENAQSGDEIWVAEDVYYPGSGREESFTMINGVAIYGGFDGTETESEQRDPSEHETVLSGDIGTSGDDSDNCYHVFCHPFGTNLDSTALLDGFTITGGNASGESSHSHGGGMYNHESSPQVINCIFSGNSAINGGGIHCSSCSPRFVKIIIIDNTVEQGGGGMNNIGSSPMLIDCVFLNNTAGHFGGGISNDMSSPTLYNCIFYNNSAIAGVGGGVSNYTYSDVILMNCTFSGNSAGDIGGGMWSGGASPMATNCIFWGDVPNEIDGGGYPAPMMTYSDIQGGYEGEGNIDADPLFIDPENGDFHLQCESPCIDAGDPESPLDPDSTRADMGVFYFDQKGYGMKGDVDNDGNINVIDIVALVNCLIFGEECCPDSPDDPDVLCCREDLCPPDENMLLRADCNGSLGNCDGDGVWNVLDAVKIANFILQLDECP